MTDRSCSCCRHYLRQTDARGECRCRAPAPSVDPDRWRWPLVGAASWCGQWAPLPQPPPAAHDNGELALARAERDALARRLADVQAERDLLAERLTALTAAKEVTP